MKELLQNLVELQSLEFDGAKGKDAETIANLRGKIPSQIIGHYDRLLARGKKGIVPVRNQVCSGCQMRLPIGVITTLMRAEDIQLCDNCGRYLYLPENEGEIAPPTAEVKLVKKSKKRKVAAVEKV
jgi:predicted  nucleic acid-binding Zn-ribbon protein